MTAIRVMIADDHTILRNGLRLLIEQQGDMEFVGEAVDWNEAQRRVGELAPDVLTVDLSMPGGEAFERLRQLRKSAPETRLIVLSMHAELAYVRAAIAAGAEGFVSKASAAEELLDAIRSVAAGQLYVKQGDSPDSDGPSDESAAQPQEDFLSLSPRERQVLRGTAGGLTNREMAEQLFLSVKTIESYRSRLMTKLALKSRAEMVQFALRHGMLGEDDSLGG